MIGRTVAEVFGDDAYARMRPDIERCLAGETVEFEFTTTDGARRRTMHISCVPHLGARTEHGSEVLGFYMLANDVTALKRAQEDLRFAAVQLQHDARRLEFLAHHDTLTGLPNRAMFADRAREAVAHARRHDKTAAFLFLDMDNFKQVNDSLGHEVGDGLLKVMASRLRASVRGDDFVARIGGRESCVLLQDIAGPPEGAAEAAQLLVAPARACAAPTTRCPAPRSSAATATSPSPACSTIRRPPPPSSPRSCAPASSVASCSSSTSRAWTSPPARWSAPRRCCAGAIRGMA